MLRSAITLLAAAGLSWLPVTAAADGAVDPRQAWSEVVQLEALADQAAKRTLARARSFRKVKLSGEALEASAKRLTDELTWHPTVEAGLAAAKAQGKPLLWIQALGELSGNL